MQNVCDRTKLLQRSIKTCVYVNGLSLIQTKAEFIKKKIWKNVIYQWKSILCMIHFRLDVCHFASVYLMLNEFFCW